MGGHAQPQTGAADRSKIGRIEIALPEMDEIAAKFDRVAPKIINDELRAVASAQKLRGFDLSTDRFVRLILNPQLDEADPARQKPRHPLCAINDQIERIKQMRGH
jgi:hypothetical protein